MTAVYSGGLVYEYVQEASKYGLVSVSGSTVTELPDFAALMAAYKATPNPSGDAGYNSTGGANGCPPKSANWQVTGDALPAIPSGAAALFKTGAGKGAGLTGKGSQNSGGTSTGTATPGSGSVAASTGTSTASKSASGSMTLGPVDKTPLFVAGLVMAFTMVGAALL